MKKSLARLFASSALAFSIAFIVVGCGSETTLDSNKLQAEFGSASGDVKADADKAIAAINAKKYGEAVTALSMLMSRSNDMSQAQILAAEETFVSANVLMFERGDKDSAAEAKANKDALNAQATGSE